MTVQLNSTNQFNSILTLVWCRVQELRQKISDAEKALENDDKDKAKELADRIAEDFLRLEKYVVSKKKTSEKKNEKSGGNLLLFMYSCVFVSQVFVDDSFCNLVPKILDVLIVVVVYEDAVVAIAVLFL